MKYSQSDGKPPSYKHANIKINRLVCKVLAIRKRKLKMTRMQSFSSPREKVENPLLRNLLGPFLLERIKNSAKKFAESKNMRTFASAFRESNCLGAVVQLG